MHSPTRRCRAALCAALLLAGSAAAETKRVDVPLVIPPAFLQRLLVEQVFSEPNSTARIVALADPCSEVVLSQPSLRPRGSRILVGAHGSAQAGITFFNGCWVPFAWEGEVEAEEDARLAPGSSVVEFHVADSRLSDASQSFGIPLLWDWIKPAVHPRLEVLRVDLGPLLGDLRRALPLFAAERAEPAARRLGDSLVLASAKVDERGLVLGVRFEVETKPQIAASPQQEAPLSDAELAGFEARLHEWDAFLTFVIKSAGREALDPSLRAALLEVLLEARYEIIAALAEPGRDGPDRVRALFQSSWQRLQPELTPLSGGREGLRYLAFVASGDALAALDQAGPSFGVEISSDGLRNLARTLVPQSSEDPLRWSEDVDPALRATFGFDAELPEVPRHDDASAAPASPPAPAATPSPAPAPLPLFVPVTPPDVVPAPEPGAALRPLSALALRLADLFWPAAAAASGPLAQPGRLPAPGPHSSSLDGFVPRLSELDRYLPEIDTLLRDASLSVFASGRLRPDLREPFERLVLATAWQESCWRQYVRSRGKVAPLRSNVGAVGLMQVNPRAWRGFYSVDGLSWSIGYNARAGSEVLLHYLRDYALARYEDQVGGPDALARATYSAYNGGPSQLRRYRQPQRWRKSLVAVDRSFLAKYRALASGAELPVRECFPG